MQSYGYSYRSGTEFASNSAPLVQVFQEDQFLMEHFRSRRIRKTPQPSCVELSRVWKGLAFLMDFMSATNRNLLRWDNNRYPLTTFVEQWSPIVLSF